MKKTKRINYWLGDKQLAKLDCQAKEAGLSRSGYIRKLICEAEVLPTPDVDYSEYAEEFRKLGVLFNEYVKDYNSTGFLDHNGSEAVWENIKKNRRQIEK